MKFGVMELFQHAPGKTARDVIEDTIEMAVHAEQLGFDCIWLAEHHFSIYGIVGNPLMVAAAIAQRTTTIKIGTAVTVLPFYDPIRLAEDAALVDVMSNGRLQLGVGRGYQPREFKHFGVDQETSRERAAEVVEVLKLAWTQERFSYSGKFFQYDDIAILPHPVQQPHPPIMHAAVSNSSFQTAAEVGDAILTSPNFTPLDRVKANFDTYKRVLTENGYDAESYDRPLMQQVYIGTDAQDAYDTPRPYSEWYNKLLSTVVPGATEKAPASYEQWDKISKNLASTTYDDIVARGANFKTAEEATKEIRQLVDVAGINNYIGWFNIGGMPRDLVFNSMERFAKDVMSNFD